MLIKTGYLDYVKTMKTKIETLCKNIDVTQDDDTKKIYNILVYKVNNMKDFAKKKVGVIPGMEWNKLTQEIDILYKKLSEKIKC